MPRGNNRRGSRGPRRRLPYVARARIGAVLRTFGIRGAQLVEVAEALEVSVRTLRNWMNLDPAEDRPRSGRPRLGEELRRQDQEHVAEVLELLGWGRGEEAVWEALERSVSRDRVRQALRVLKPAKRRRRRAARREARVSTLVHARDAMWCVDATHLGRTADGRAVQAEVLRDVASGRTLGITVGFAATGREVAADLARAVQRRGCAPLVLVQDNGAAYAAQPTRSWCRDHGVLQLFSLPRTPQHNAVAERGMRDLKEESGLGDELVLDIVQVRDRLAQSVGRIDAARPRKTKGWRTACEVDAAMPSWEGLVDRNTIYREASCAIEKAVLHSENKRAQRRAVREAILGTLERYHVITRTRGPRC